MEVGVTGESVGTDIPTMKEVARDVMGKIESEVNGSDVNKNADTISSNGEELNGVTNGTDAMENGDSEDILNNHKSEDNDNNMVVDTINHIGKSGDNSIKNGKSTEVILKEVEPSIKHGSESENVEKSDSKTEGNNVASEEKPPDASEPKVEGGSQEPSTPEKKDDDLNDDQIRRSGRKKSPKKYQELLLKEIESIEAEESEEEVEEVRDDDSDVQEIDAEDPLAADTGMSESSSKKEGEVKKPNVVTIDDLKTLQRLATSAKQSVDKQKTENITIIDTQSIIAGKMGSGVSITPAKSRIGSSSSAASSPLNISPAGMTLGSGVTIKPNKPSTPLSLAAAGVSVTPVVASEREKSGSSTPSQDPNLTDDTFVVEAPSFIVPYVYEKPPKEAIKDFKESIDEMQAEKKKAKEKKKAAGEEVSDDEPEKEEKKIKDDEDDDEKKEVAKDEEKKKDAYFDSTLGKFFIELGMNLVQEYVQRDLLKQQIKRSHKDKSAAVMHAIKSLQQNLDDSKDNNEDFKFEMRKCKFCSFRTESRLVMQHHMETPHMRNFVYRCNFCEFETKIPQEVLFHMDNEHGVKGKLERAPYFHQCPQCPFEDNGKGKLTRHKMGCDKRFKQEQNQVPDRDWDPPAKIKPPPIRPGYTGYMNPRPTGAPGNQMLRPGSSLLPRGGAGFQSNQSRFAAQRGAMMAAARGRPVGSYKGGMAGGADLRIPNPGSSGNQLRMRGMSPAMFASQKMLEALNQQGLSVSGGKSGGSGSVTIQSLGQKGANKSNSPSISITPLPGRNNPGQKSASPSPSTPKPGQPGAGQGGKGNFVICEICDGYIKDLEQLRNHMQWIHKVKIHPKMIYNRPPLNCQKCQFRFFTDQGLERHLLGSHGLVTASMQDAANKGQDSGRCPVCGKVYQWKLLNHVAKDHGKTLKPAHLSYKCTVCTATFGQYKLFENHVYTAHSGVAKKGDKNKQAAKAGASSAVKTPVKLSDEISIIPSKKSADKGGKTTEVVDLEDEEEIDDVEKEVIDLDTPKKKEDGGKRSAEEDSEKPEVKKIKTDESEDSKPE